MTASFLSDPMAAKADALRSVYNPGERLVLFKQADTSGRGVEPIDFDGTGSGIVKARWQKETTGRRFYREPGVPPVVKVFFNRRYTTALLATVAAYGILLRGSSTLTEISMARPDGGVPQTTDEIAWRWLGGERVTFLYTDPGYVGGPVITSEGDLVLWG